MADKWAKRFPSDTPIEVYGPGNPQTETDPLSLHLDQTTPQSMTGVWAFQWVAPDTLELYINGVKAQSWTVAPVAPVTLGSPMGLLLTLTYPA